MAKTSKKKMAVVAKKNATTKHVVKENTAKQEPKQIAVAKEPEKISTAKDLEKISVAKEPKKITTSKELEKISVTKEPEKISMKEEKVEKKETNVEDKKTQSKVKKEKSTTKKEAKTKKKISTKKNDEKKEEEKKTKKTSVKKTTKKDKLIVYNALSLDECITRMHAMGVHHEYDTYAKFLLDEASMKKLEKNIIEGNKLNEKNFDFDKDGFDLDLVLITLKKVADTMDIKAMDFKEIKKDMNVAMKIKYSEDVEENAAEYLKEFRICEKLLMIGQRKNISDSAKVSELVGSDVDAFVDHFFAFAYDILPTWQYNDVKFYEDFVFAILSQYYDLFIKYQLRILLDVADLYIKHGDFQHGDECYGYILRDNQIKDYIYYRFVSVYEPIDFNKAKSLAYEALQYVDGRYTYYKNIMDVINK